MAPRRSTPPWPSAARPVPCGRCRPSPACPSPITSEPALRTAGGAGRSPRRCHRGRAEGFTSDTSGITLAAGTQTLNGEEALAFARERHAVSSGDFSRAAAQRAIISAIADEVLASPPTEMPSLVGSLAACVTTDYTVAELADTALALKDAGVTVYSAACPSYSFGEGGISYVGVMYDEWRAMMQRVDAGLDPADESAEIPEPQVGDEDLGCRRQRPLPARLFRPRRSGGFKDN